MTPTVLELARRIGTALEDPAVALGLEITLATEASLWLEDVPACIAVVLTGPPGGAKSTVISIARGERDRLYYTDSVSPHSFVSHYAGKTRQRLESEVDLLPKIAGKALLISDLGVRIRCGPAAVGQALGLHPPKDLVELLVRDVKSVMMALQLFRHKMEDASGVLIVGEVDGKLLVEGHLGEPPLRWLYPEAEDLGEQLGGGVFVLRRNDKVV